MPAGVTAEGELFGMAMNIDDPNQLSGATVVGGDGQKLGNVDSVYFDNATDQPEWVAVRSGIFGTRVTLVPLRRADYAEDALHVPFNKVQLRNAPYHDPGRELSASEEADLYRYYGIDYGTSADDAAATVEMALGRPGAPDQHPEPVAEPVERIRRQRQSATERMVDGDARSERMDRETLDAARHVDHDADRIDPERDVRDRRFL
jgi:sporulation protein YlmC with PRC-barrel domain